MYSAQFKTNRDRLFCAGVYLKPEDRWVDKEEQWQLWDRPAPTKHAIFYQSAPSGIRWLAFNNEFEYQEGLDGPLPLASDNSLNSRKEPFFYSRADLSGLLHVTICRIGDSDVVSGLLLHFYDDRTEAVGQVRLDFLRDELPAGHAKPLYLGFKRDGDGCPYVSTVSNSPIRDPGIESVIKLSGGGILEWFWSCWQCLVIYKGQKSPDTASINRFAE